MDMSLSKLREIVKAKEASYTAVQGVTKNQTQPSHWTTAMAKPLSPGQTLALQTTEGEVDLYGISHHTY